MNGTDPPSFLTAFILAGVAGLIVLVVGLRWLWHCHIERVQKGPLLYRIVCSPRGVFRIEQCAAFAWCRRWYDPRPYPGAMRASTPFETEKEAREAYSLLVENERRRAAQEPPPKPRVLLSSARRRWWSRWLGPPYTPEETL